MADRFELGLQRFLILIGYALARFEILLLQKKTKKLLAVWLNLKGGEGFSSFGPKNT